MGRADSVPILYRPAWPLGRFVKTIWYYEGYTQPHAFERLMPDGSMGVVINLDDDRVRIYESENLTKFRLLEGAIFMGAQTEFFIIDTAEQRNVIGAQFAAGGAFPFLDAPAGELEGLHVSVGDLLPAEHRRIRERLLEIPSPVERCRQFERELLAMAAGRMEIRADVAYAAKALDDPARSVADVAACSGLSSRRLTQVFRDAVGLTPKAYSRVRRFQRALRGLQSPEAPDWVEIALDCGYYDQSHFNNDFREFSGIVPSEYVAVKTPHLNHVPLG